MKALIHDWLHSLLLLTATYNPTGWCYLAWVEDRPYLPASVVVVFGSILVAGYVYFLKAAIGGLGKLGTIALFCFLWSVLWMLSDLKIIPKDAGAHWVWLAILISSLTLAIGKTWPRLRRGKILSNRRTRRAENHWKGFGE